MPIHKMRYNISVQSTPTHVKPMLYLENSFVYKSIPLRNIYILVNIETKSKALKPPFNKTELFKGQFIPSLSPK